MAADPAPVEPGPPSALAMRAGALYLNVFIVAICGLVYELLAGTLGSYLLGDSVTQFSLVIGLYLSAMGGGAWLSRRLESQLARRFVDICGGVPFACNADGRSCGSAGAGLAGEMEDPIA